MNLQTNGSTLTDIEKLTVTKGRGERGRKAEE